jgi:HSP20 family protein
MLVVEESSMSARGSPFDELERMFERMSRQFGEASQMWGGDGSFGRPTSETTAMAMAMDLVEHDDEFVVTIDLPGFEREDVELKLTDRTLRVEADREATTEAEGEEYLRRERRHESAHRSIRLPEGVDPEGVTARMKNGVLTVTLPRLEAESAQTIEIEDD